MKYCTLAVAILAAFGLHAEESDVTTLKSVNVAADLKGAKKSSGALGNKSELDTPFSTKTKSSLDIERIQASSVTELYASDASVARTGSDYNPYGMRGLTIRGLPVDIYASMRIDGLPAGYLYGVSLPLEDMDQVQLLKGAAGFLFGFGTPGGIFNYTLKKPTDQTTFSFDAGYRSSSLFSQHVDAGGRAFGNGLLGYQLNLSHESGTSYTGSQVDRKAASLSLDAEIAPGLTWKASVLAQDRTIDNPTPIIYASRYAQTRLPKALAGDTNWSADQDTNKTKFFYATTGIDWAINDNWHLLADVSRTRTRFRFSQEYAYLLDDTGSYQGRTFDSLTVAVTEYAQAMLQGSFETGPLRHSLVAGVSRQRAQYDVALANYAGTQVQGTWNIYSPTQISWDALADDLKTYPIEVTLQKAAFLSDTIEFAPNWSLLLGWRYNDYSDNSASTPTYDANGQPVFSFTKYAKKVTTPTYALLYKPAPGQTLYASYVESLEQGSMVGTSYVNSGEVLPPLTSEQYELGYKAERGRWNAAAAIFRVDRGAAYANASNVYVQDGVIRYDGVEVSADAALTDSVRLGGSITYLDASYKETGTAWLIGKAPTGTSKVVAALNLQYQPSQVPGLSLYANARHVSEGIAANNTSAQVVVKAPAYSVFDIGSGYQMALGTHQLTLRLGINNLFDKQYWQAGSSLISIGAPRAYSFNAKYDW